MVQFAGPASADGEEDGDSAAAKLPSFPDFEGLVYKAGAALPQGVQELSYSPEPAAGPVVA